MLYILFLTVPPHQFYRKGRKDAYECLKDVAKDAGKGKTVLTQMKSNLLGS